MHRGCGFILYTRHFLTIFSFRVGLVAKGKKMVEMEMQENGYKL